jgi:sugar lactone lactonase YvrE
VIEAGALRSVGHDLARPECVVVDAETGTLFCSDARGGVMSIARDGSQHLLGRREGLVPNGLARLPDGSFLIANVGAEGGVWHLDADGAIGRVDIRLEGRPLPEVNFVHVDAQGRLWLSISSRGAPDPVFRPDANEGMVVLGDRSGFHVVASALGWTNELRVSADGRRLYVNETFGRRLLSFAIGDGGALSDRTVLARFGHGDYPDGMALDAEGGVWVVSIISNRVYRFKDGRAALVFSDSRPEIVDRLEVRFTGPGFLRRDLHGLTTGNVVGNLSSIAFGGPQRRTVWLGSLNGTCLWSFDAPVAGVEIAAVWPMASLRLG